MENGDCNGAVVAGYHESRRSVSYIDLPYVRLLLQMATEEPTELAHYILNGYTMLFVMVTQLDP